MAENLWAKSADAAKRKKAYEQHKGRQDTKEMETTNVVRRSPLDTVRGKYGERKAR